MLAERFQVMYRRLGLDLAGCAKLLHVTERTLHNWQSGKHDIPYAAYRLLRMLCGMELPGQAWKGWTFSGGKLWSPEGRSFVGTDSAWWSLLVRRADISDLLRRKVEAREAGHGGRAGVSDAVPRAAGKHPSRSEVPVTPHFSLTDETTPSFGETQVSAPRDVPVTRPFSTEIGTNDDFVTASNVSSKEAA